MARIVFTDAGVQVFPAGSADDPWYNERGVRSPEDLESMGDPKFQGRIPVVYYPEHRELYLGGPNWYHDDVYSHHGVNRNHEAVEGYFGSKNPDWGSGDLKWFHGVPPEDHQQAAQALQQAGYHIPNPEAPPIEEYDYEDPALWESLGEDHEDLRWD